MCPNIDVTYHQRILVHRFLTKTVLGLFSFTFDRKNLWGLHTLWIGPNKTVTNNISDDDSICKRQLYKEHYHNFISHIICGKIFKLHSISLISENNWHRSHVESPNKMKLHKILRSSQQNISETIGERIWM
jgi:hypothetical protein